MQNEYNCPVDATISKIGGKYKAVILYHLGNDTLRYNQIREYPKVCVNLQTDVR